MSRDRIAKFTIGACIVLYLACFLFPAFRAGDDVQWPAKLLAIGWIGPLGGVVYWYANPCLWAALALFRFTLASLALASIGGALAVGFAIEGRFMANEAGHYDKVTAFGAGYALWVAAFAVLILGQLLVLVRRPGRNAKGAV